MCPVHYGIIYPYISGDKLTATLWYNSSYSILYCSSIVILCSILYVHKIAVVCNFMFCFTCTVYVVFFNLHYVLLFCPGVSVTPIFPYCGINKRLSKRSDNAMLRDYTSLSFVVLWLTIIEHNHRVWNVLSTSCNCVFTEWVIHPLVSLI